MKKSVSLICVYNNEEQLNNCLVKTLSIQSLECEMIFIDGSNGSFPSCASALNYGVSKSCGEVLIFTHQDIFLKTDSEIDRFSSFILNMPKGTIVGVAGAKEKDKCNIGNYTSGINIDRNLVFSISEPKEVSCIDECFFGMRRDTFNLHPFDENLCDDWHLYAVEQCLYHRKNGGTTYVFPAQIHHISRGTISLNYMNGLCKLSKHYRNAFKWIWTTCYKVRTSLPFIYTLKYAWLLNRIIRRKKY